MSIPKILTDISDYLISKKIELSSEFEDGRVNSAVNEDEILNIIAAKFDIQNPRARNWFDFAIENEGVFYPVNIKITDTAHADNLNCKLGIYYALTGVLPNFPNEIRWLSYFDKVKNNLGTNESKDYYFLVCNKNNPSDVFVNSLKGLQKLQENGNNLPFQCKWDINREFQNRSFDEAKDFILSVFGASIKLRSEIYFNFKRCFPQYV